MEYFLHDKGVQVGPYTEQQARGMWANGAVTSAALYCINGTSNWLRLVELCESARENESSLSARLELLSKGPLEILNPKTGTLYSAFCRNYPRTNGTLARCSIESGEFDVHKTSDGSFALKYTKGMFFKSQHTVMLSKDTKEIGRLPDSFAQQTWKHYLAKKGSGGGNLLTHGIFYAVNLALAKGDGIGGFYIHFSNEAGSLEQAVLLGSSQLIDKVVITQRTTTEPKTYKSAHQLADELILLFGDEEIKSLYLNNFPDDALLNGRYLYTVFIFIMVVTLIIGQRCKNPSMPKTLAECHRQFMTCWGENPREFLSSTFVISIDERFKLYEILHDHNAMDIAIDKPDEWRIPLGTLIHASLLIRGDMYNQELASIQASFPESSINLDKLFLAWAMKSHQLITESGLPDPNANPYQKTMHIMCLKEALSTYYNAIIDIFDGQ
jgi:hypothetical protein